MVGAQLTDVHRRAQASLAARSTAQLLTIWPLLDGADLDGTAERWLAAAVPVVEARHSESVSLSLSYLRQFRSIEVPDAAPFTEPPRPVVNTDAVRTSLMVRGPVLVRQLERSGMDTGAAMARASTAASGAGERHILNGGREMGVAYADADPVATGWRRVARSGCCAFCALLAARSYDGLSSDATGAGREAFKVHDHCKCSSETSYLADGGDPQYVERHVREFAALYREAAAGVTGGGTKKLNAFRRALAEQRKA